MRALLSSVGEVVGIACATVGAGMAWPPLGWIVAGCGIFVVSYVAGGDE